jgi:hypothetical protein
MCVDSHFPFSNRCFGFVPFCTRDRFFWPDDVRTSRFCAAMEDKRAQKREAGLIRQAISCDICGTDMQQTNHWFVAYDQGAELRLAAWNTRARLRAGVKHLCGQTCLHKLVDEFLARTAPVRTGSQADAVKTAGNVRKDAAARPGPMAAATVPGAVPRLAPRPVGSDFEPYVDEYESSAQMIPAVEVGTLPSAVSPLARTWHSEAWKREREREQNAARQTGVPRRRSIA